MSKAEVYRAPEGVQIQPMHAARPNGATYVAVGTVATPPVYVHTTAPGNTAEALGVRRAVLRQPPPAGRWADGICDWPGNLYPSCYCACCVCCGIYLVAQSNPLAFFRAIFGTATYLCASFRVVSEKVGYSTFKGVLAGFAVSCIIAFILQLIVGAALIIWIPLLYSFTSALILRVHIAHRQNIHECGQNPCLGEFCTGFWCWYCSVAQMGRHVYGYNKVLDGDGDPERPDNYAPLQQV
eukprot:gene36347-44091_t